MTQKKSYSRYFIILQEDEKGYALGSDKLPSGYAKLEIKNDKCKISYYVQNLKKESAPYFMVLICNKKDVKKIIRIGELNIDEHGRAEVSYEYPVENVANCNVGVDKIVGAGIVRFMNTNLISVMSGFTSTEIPEWKSFVIVEDDQKRHEVKVEVKPEVQLEVKPEVIVKEKVEEIPREENNMFDEYEMKIEEEKGAEEIKLLPADEEQIEVNTPNDDEEKSVLNEDSYYNNEEQIEADSENDRQEEKKVLNEDEYYNNEELRHKKKSEKDKCEPEHKCKKENEDHKEDNFKGVIGSFFKDLTEGFEELEGYFQEIKRCKWYKVPVNRPEDIHSCHDYNKHTVVYYPMINYYPYLGKHKHFIFGYKFDKENKMKYLVYGVPGRRAKMDQPFGGKSGFVTWVPLTPGDEEEYSMGYWLMFYDFKNSTIVIPLR